MNNTEVTEEQKAALRGDGWLDQQAVAKLKSELDKYKQAELPRYPHTIKIMLQCSDGIGSILQQAITEVLSYIDEMTILFAASIRERNALREEVKRLNEICDRISAAGLSNNAA